MMIADITAASISCLIVIEIRLFIILTFFVLVLLLTEIPFEDLLEILIIL